jgi:hypothetical protein
MDMPSDSSGSTSEGTQPQPIIDEPGDHGMFMLGTETLFLCHMPMFTMEKHMYQLILRASLPPDVMQRYRLLRRANPRKPYNLQNSNPFTLPEIKSGAIASYLATIYDGYAGEDPGPPLWGSDTDPVTVTVENIVRYRHFDFGIAHPDEMTYIVYGRGDEAHLSHYIARETDFQHELTLPAPPPWLSASQVEAGADVSVIGMPSLPTPCANPLAQPSYHVRYQGRGDTDVVLDLGANPTAWFSTGNVLNSVDPCEH